MRCKDGSDRNPRAKDGFCLETGIPCTPILIRSLSPKCENYDPEYATEYPQYYQDFDYQSDCADLTDMICIERNSTSKCDLHPQCLHGEDEIGCKDDYVRKGIFKPSETFECDDPNYLIINLDNSNWTIKTQRAFRCDGRATCPNGEDEENCKILAETIKYILRE